MNQITLTEPRTTTRMVYQLAISTAPSDGARADLLAALQWYELKWQAIDRAQQQAQQTQEPPPTP